MSANSKSNEWDSLWGEYSKSLENWKAIFEQFQNASNEMQTKFNKVWEKAGAESSTKTMKDFTEKWQKSMSDAQGAITPAQSDCMVRCSLWRSHRAIFSTTPLVKRQQWTVRAIGPCQPSFFTAIE